MRLLRALTAFLLSSSPAAAQTRLLAPAPLAPTAFLPGPTSVAGPAFLAPLFPAAALTSPLSATIPSNLPPALRPVSPVATAQPSALAQVQNAASYAPQKGSIVDFHTAVFDGGRLGREGEHVYPKLMSTDSTSLRIPFQSAILRAIVDELLPHLEESVVQGEWFGPRTTLDGPACGDAAPKLAALLREKGVPARLVEAEFHYYVIIDTPDGWVVVDPTIRQFFGREKAPRSVPTVFVGSLGELRVFFERHAGQKSTRYGVERLYLSQARDREAQVASLLLALRTSGARDLVPLRRALGLPPL